MAKHASLVSSIAAKCGQPIATQSSMRSVRTGDAHSEAAQRLLQQVLQRTAEEACAGTAAPAAAASEQATATPAAPAATDVAVVPAASSAVAAPATEQQQQQQQQQRWRLASFSSNLSGAAALLPVLPAHSLTHLDLELQGGREELKHLEHLSMLQRLRLDSPSSPMPSASSCLAGLAKLNHLTSLTLSGRWEGINKQLHELLMQQLPLLELEDTVLDFDRFSGAMSAPCLTHLTQLTKLGMDNDLQEGMLLPTQLNSLRLGSCSDLAPLLQLQQLQHLSIFPEFEQPTQILALAQLPALQTLSLVYTSTAAAAAAAPTWALLPALRAVHVQCFDESVSDRPEIAIILAGAAAAATSLTSLIITSYALPRCQFRDAMALRDRLVDLTGLKELEMFGMPLVPGDAIALTALTGLTRLNLGNARDGVGQAAAVALARSLSDLEDLALRNCNIDLGSLEVMTAIGQLGKLRHLVLQGNSGLMEQGLMQLTGLSHLQRLLVDTNAEVTDQVLDRFNRALRNVNHQV
jgi:hypothetical protein